MTTWGGAAIALFLIAGLAWIVSGRDPLWWAIHALIVLRAAIAQAYVECKAACFRWWRAMPAAIEDARRSVAEAD